MTRDDLVREMATVGEISKAKADAALRAFIDGVSVALARGEDVVLTGFMKLSVKVRAARKARNPQTGEIIDVAEKKGVRFKPGKSLLDKVQGKV